MLQDSGRPNIERKSTAIAVAAGTSTHPCGTSDQIEADLLAMAEPEDLATARDRVEAASIFGRVVWMIEG